MHIFISSVVAFILTFISTAFAQYDTSLSGGFISSPLAPDKTDLFPSLQNISFMSARLQEEIKNTGFATISLDFETDKDALKEEHNSIIESIAHMLTMNSEWRLRIEGHTDSNGDQKSNLKLSQRRSISIFNALISKGISPDRLEPIGFGQNNPVAKNDTAEGRAKNRRVELHLK